MSSTPHREKLLAAITNPKCSGDVTLLNEALTAYENWITQTIGLTSNGEERITL